MATATAETLKQKAAALREEIAKARQPQKQGLSTTQIINAGDRANDERVSAQAKDSKLPPTGGFKNFSHFCNEVRKAEIRQATPTLVEWEKTYTGYYKAAGMTETVGSEGGYLVPPEFSSELLRRTYDNDLLKRTRSYPVTGDNLSIPAIDETSRVDGSRFGGVRAFWDAEAAQFTSSKPAYSRIDLKLKKLIAICYATDELLQDSGVALQSHLMDLFSQEVAFKIGDAIVNGSGAGMPQGILNAPALVSISKETGQAATTLLFENINKMWQHMYAPSRQNAIWLINQDVENQLDAMTLGIGTAGVPVYLPPGGVSEKPYATLKGRPVVPVEFCATLGTQGDIILADLSQYVTIRKGETQTETSIHFKFDTAEVAFRVLFRMDGTSWWQNGLTPYKGSNTLSPFVACNTRS